MIGSLRGVLVHRSVATGEVVIEVAGGVGYRVVLAPSAAASLGETGSEVFVHVHHHVREDAEVLYGFASVEERMVFDGLLRARGVGPALALAILSVHDPRTLRSVVAEGDREALCLVPGVGKKTADRLLLELGGVLDIADLAELEPVGTAGGITADPSGAGTGGADLAIRADVREALRGLGYAPEEVRAALDALPSEGSAEDLLKFALQRLATA